MFGQEASAPQIVERHTLHFSTIRPEDLIGLTPDGTEPYTPTDRWPISRGAAIRLPAVKRGRDLIAGTIATLPLVARLADRTERQDLPVLQRLDPSRSYAWMIASTVDDLMFYGVSWWHVTSRSSSTGLPVAYERLDPRSLSLQEQPYNITTPYSTTAQTRIWDDDPDIIRFDAITDPLLTVAAGTIRNALRLEAAAAMYSDGTPPAEWFEPADGVDPEDTDVAEFMAAWEAARRTRTSAYVPAAFKRYTDGFNPDQLQMSESRQQVALQIANFLGIDGEDVNVPVTTRTYFNAQDRQQQRIRSTLALYFAPIEQRLSMDDVTPHGTRVLFDLSELLRADDMTRFQAYAAGRAVGVYEDVNAVRRAEKVPELPPGVAPEPVTAPAPSTTPDDAGAADDVDQAAALAAADDAVLQFSGAPAPLLLAAPVAVAFRVDQAKRTITGLAVPYGSVSRPESMTGQRYQFKRGDLVWPADVTRVKLTSELHEARRAVGVVTAFEEHDDGLYATARVAPGAAGDELLTMAAEGVWDGLSVGLLPGGRFTAGRDGVYVATSPSEIAHLTVLPDPAFPDARIYSVAASAAATTDEEGSTMPDEATEDTTAALPALDLSPDTIQAIAAAFAAAIPAPAETEIPTAGTRTPAGPVQVNEPECYRFDGLPGAHGFTNDLKAALFSNDHEARQRLEREMPRHFERLDLRSRPVFDAATARAFAAISPANVASLNPDQQRPDMYVERAEYDRPLWESISTGTIADSTPFVIPKFSTATNLGAAHVSATEPADATFTTTAQTVTPAPVSGRAILPREIVDAGGNPAVDQILWTMMTGNYFELIEAKINTALAGVATAEENLAGAVDEALVDAMTAILIDAQYARGGNRFRRLVLDGSLFSALVNASDTTGRKLLPVIGAQNAQGGTSATFNAVQLGAMTGRAAWPLGSGVAAQSYLLNPSRVWAWASPPRRFTFEYQVSTVTLAIWGHTAAEVIEDAGVRPIDYTTADV